MKKHKIQLVAIAATLIPCMSYAQYNNSQLVTFALTDTYSAPSILAKDQTGKPLKGEDGKPYFVYEQSYSTTRGTVVTTTQESGSRMVTERISNKQILEALVEAGVITDITGYSIALYTNDNEGGVAFHLVKAGSSAINISEYLYPDSETSGGEAVTSSAMRVVATSSSSESVIRNTSTETSKEGVSILFKTPQVDVKMYGILNFTESLRTIGTGTAQRTITVPGPGSVTNIIGSSASEDVEEEDSLIEGRINLGPGVLLPVVG